MNGYGYERLRVNDYILFDAARRERRDLPPHLRKPARIIRLGPGALELDARCTTGGIVELRDMSIYSWSQCTADGKLIVAEPYILRQNGSFTADFPRTDGRCGPIENDQFTYRVEISVLGLDAEGYSIDATLAQRYFDQTYTHAANLPVISCEKIARRACDYFRSQVRAGVQIISCEVGISPVNGREAIAR